MIQWRYAFGEIGNRNCLPVDLRQAEHVLWAEQRSGHLSLSLAGYVLSLEN